MFVEAAFCRSNDNNMVKMTAMTSCKYSGHKLAALFTTPVIFADLPEEESFRTDALTVHTCILRKHSRLF